LCETGVVKREAEWQERSGRREKQERQERRERQERQERHAFSTKFSAPKKGEGEGEDVSD
jgi:hypothetical protein